MKFKILLSLLLIPFLTQATIWRVDGSGDTSADFQSLQEAVDNASAGDTIYVRPTGGDYGNIVVNKTLTLIGTGYYLSFNDSTQYFNSGSSLSSIVFNSGSNGSIIKGFQLTGSSQVINVSGFATTGSIVLNDCCIFVEKCFLQNGIGLTWAADACLIVGCYSPNGTIRIEGGVNLGLPSQGVSSLVVSNSVFRDYQPFFGGLPGVPKINVMSADFYRCVFQGVGNNTISIRAVNSTFRDCIFLGTSDSNYNESGSTFENCLDIGNGITTGTNNLTGVEFTSLFDASQSSHPERRYILSDTSPAKNFATDGGDCGIFGGPDPYVLSGMPDIPSIFELNVASQGDGSSQSLDVNLKAKSHD